MKIPLFQVGKNLFIRIITKYIKISSPQAARHPRPTTVELFDRTMNCIFTEALKKFIPGMSWGNVKSLISELVNEERELPEEGFLITHTQVGDKNRFVYGVVDSVKNRCCAVSASLKSLPKSWCP